MSNPPPPPPHPPRAPPAVPVAAAAGGPPAGAAVNPPPPPPPAPVPFLVVPADATGIIDYSTRQGLAIYEAAARSLYADPTENYDVDAQGLQTFISLI